LTIFYTEKFMQYFLEKVGWDTFWTIYQQAHLVTLDSTSVGRERIGEGENRVRKRGGGGDGCAVGRLASDRMSLRKMA
jgi:hypothetical protein